MAVHRSLISGSDGEPLIAVHSWRHDARDFSRLSAVLGDQRICSLLPPDPEAGPLPRRVEAWVDYHEATFDSLDLEPPYRLVGFSFGGLLALELARRLRERRLEVEYVGLIDTVRPRLAPVSTTDFVWHHLGVAAGIAPGERKRYLRGRAGFLAARIAPRTVKTMLRGMQATGLRDRQARTEIDKPSDPLVIAVHVAYLNYIGEPVPFPVHIYVTDESAQRAETPVLRWLPWLHGGFTITEIAGDHLTIFTDDNIHSIAEAMAGHLGLATRGSANDRPSASDDECAAADSSSSLE